MTYDAVSYTQTRSRDTLSPHRHGATTPRCPRTAIRARVSLRAQMRAQAALDAAYVAAVLD